MDLMLLRKNNMQEEYVSQAAQSSPGITRPLSPEARLSRVPGKEEGPLPDGISIFPRSLRAGSFHRAFIEFFCSQLASFYTSGYVFKLPCRALEPSSGPAPRCRGCGGRSERASSERNQPRQTDKRIRPMPTLCTNCHRFVEQMRQDTRIMAVFIFSLGNETKYYAGIQNSSS
ncbi:MAG: hypothetical protein QOE55_6081 [Acidobacteriaceae bacterium]|nr:hypothetical protein [Acidobacteriaceae bacterium]